MIQRYDQNHYAEMQPFDDGTWVRYADIEPLQRIAQIVRDSSIAGGRAFDEGMLYEALRISIDLGFKPSETQEPTQ